MSRNPIARSVASPFFHKRIVQDKRRREALRAAEEATKEALVTVCDTPDRQWFKLKEEINDRY